MRQIKFKGTPLTLVGRVLKEKNKGPDFCVVSSDLKEINLSHFSGKIKLINSFPSLDTPVCDLQVKEFNQKSTAFSEDIVVLGISKDLPFAQKRFLENFNIKNVFLFSDYRYSSFGINYGLLIKELNLLARAAIILDKNNIVRYIQIKEELTESLDYEGVLKKLEEVVKNPQITTEEEQLSSQCKPCEVGGSALAKEKIEQMITQCKDWQLKEEKKLVKEFKFKDFLEAKYFLDLISLIAEREGHHPNFTLIYNKLKVTLTTHAAGGLTENDFIMARIIDSVKGDSYV